MVEPVRPLFFFDAQGSTVREVARAVSEFWAVSVLVASGGDSKVEGRIITADLETALASLSLFAGVPYRRAADGVYFFGGAAEKELVALPTYGLPAREVMALAPGGGIVGDRLMIEAPAVRIAQVRDALQSMRDRPSVVVEVFVVDASTNTVDRVNAWLDSVRVGGGYLAKSALVAANPSAGAIGAVRAVSGPVYDVQVSGLFDLLETDSSARVELRQQAQILSGSQTQLESGQVEERQLYVREPGTPGGAGHDLSTRIERRTVGLQLTLTAAAYPGGWQLRVELQDSDIVAGKERTTTFKGDRRVSSSERGFFLLGSFTRDGVSSAGRGVPVLGEAPGWLGRQFRKRETVRNSRSVMILGRVVAGQ